MVQQDKTTTIKSKTDKSMPNQENGWNYESAPKL